MSDNKRKRAAPLSGLSVKFKFGILDILLLLAIVIAWFAMANTVNKVLSDKYDQMEKSVISATEQVTMIGIESAVSIAKNIYTNEPVYDFLNKKYSSSSEYFEAYYPLLENTALNTADTNIVKKCTIYTSNPTILPGSILDNIDSVKEEEWYKTMQNYNKPTVLYIDHRNGAMTLVRKLDYITLDTGESYLCLKLNNDFLKDFAGSLDFEGQFYIMSGGSLIYSNNEKISSISDITITPDFECMKRNYYTVDIEYYSCADKKGVVALLLENKILLPCLIAILILFNLAVVVMASGIIRRIRPVVSEFSEKGSISNLEKGVNGTDEIGKLLDVCSEVSARLTKQGSDYIESSASLMQKSDEFNSLFTTAMRIDAELAVITKLPYLHAKRIEDNILLSDESELIEKTAEKFGAVFEKSGTEETKLFVPAYSFVLVARDIFTNYKDVTVNITSSENEAEITFESDNMISSSDKLKLNAIFEDDNISSEYCFDKYYRFNPYLRIKHCLKSNVEIEINSKDHLMIMFRIHSIKEKGE